MAFTIDDLHEIAAESGLAHARFCLEQSATQEGREALAKVFAELAGMEDIEADKEAEVAEKGYRPQTAGFDK